MSLSFDPSYIFVSRENYRLIYSLSLLSLSLLSSFADISQRPLVANGVFVAPSASVIGEVLLYGDASVRS